MTQLCMKFKVQSIHCIRMARNSNIPSFIAREYDADLCKQNIRSFYTFDYYDYIQYLQPQQLSWITMAGLPESELPVKSTLHMIDVAANMQLLADTRPPQKGKAIFEGNAEKPFLAVYMLSIKHNSYKRLESVNSLQWADGFLIDLAEGLETSAASFLKEKETGQSCSEDCIHVFHTLNSCDLFLVLRTQSIENVYSLEDRLKSGEALGKENVTFSVMTILSLDFPDIKLCATPSTDDLDRILRSKLNPSVLEKNKNANIQLRFCFHRVNGNESVESELFQSAMHAIHFSKMLGRYGMSTTISLEEFSSLYPYLYIKKFAPHLFQSQKLKPYFQNSVKQFVGNGKVHTLASLLVLQKTNIVNERVALSSDNQSGDCASEEPPFELRDPFPNNNAQPDWWKACISHLQTRASKLIEQYPVTYSSVKDFGTNIRLMLETISIFAPIGYQAEIPCGGYDFLEICHTMLKCVEDYLDEMRRLYIMTGDTPENKDVKDDAAYFLQLLVKELPHQMSVAIERINDMLKCLYQQNNQTLQAPIYDLHIRISSAKYLMAYQEFIYQYYEWARSTAEEASDRIFPIVGINHDNLVTTNSLFPRPNRFWYPDTIDKPDEIEQLVSITVPSIENVVRIYDTIPTLLHEMSHRFRGTDRKKRNQHYLAYAYSRLSSMIASYMFNNAAPYDNTWLGDGILAPAVNAITSAFKKLITHESWYEYKFRDLNMVLHSTLSELVLSEPRALQGTIYPSVQQTSSNLIFTGYRDLLFILDDVQRLGGFSNDDRIGRHRIEDIRTYLLEHSGQVDENSEIEWQPDGSIRDGMVGYTRKMCPESGCPVISISKLQELITQNNKIPAKEWKLPDPYYINANGQVCVRVDARIFINGPLFSDGRDDNAIISQLSMIICRTIDKWLSPLEDMHDNRLPESIVAFRKVVKQLSKQPINRIFSYILGGTSAGDSSIIGFLMLANSIGMPNKEYDILIDAFRKQFDIILNKLQANMISSNKIHGYLRPPNEIERTVSGFRNEVYRLVQLFSSLNCTSTAILSQLSEGPEVKVCGYVLRQMLIEEAARNLQRAFDKDSKVLINHSEHSLLQGSGIFNKNIQVLKKFLQGAFDRFSCSDLNSFVENITEFHEETASDIRMCAALDFDALAYLKWISKVYYREHYTISNSNKDSLSDRFTTVICILEGKNNHSIDRLSKRKDTIRIDLSRLVYTFYQLVQNTIQEILSLPKEHINSNPSFERNLYYFNRIRDTLHPVKKDVPSATDVNMLQCWLEWMVYADCLLVRTTMVSVNLDMGALVEGTYYKDIDRNLYTCYRAVYEELQDKKVQFSENQHETYTSMMKTFQEFYREPEGNPITPEQMQYSLAEFTLLHYQMHCARYNDYSKLQCMKSYLSGDSISLDYPRATGGDHE